VYRLVVNFVNITKVSVLKEIFGPIKNNMPLRKLSYLVIAVILVITGCNAYFASQLRFDYNFDHFFPEGDEDLAYYHEYRAQFGNDNDYILLGIDAPNSVFE